MGPGEGLDADEAERGSQGKPRFPPGAHGGGGSIHPLKEEDGATGASDTGEK